MFNGAQKVVVTGGTFVVNAENSTSTFQLTRSTSPGDDIDTFSIISQVPILQPLLDRVTLNAILNAGGRADEVGYYPGTREMVIGQVERWMDGQSELGNRIFWLSGPAGAVKSAIMQTVAERCKERSTHAANFFFRDDGTRNSAQPLMATLVYQLLEFYPALHAHLNDCLTTKPLTYKASTKEQFTQFISSPFQIIRHSSSVFRPIILIFDGLDECKNKREQGQILKSLQALVDADNSLAFCVLVASQAEHHLKTFFNKKRILVESIFLDGTYGPEDDIRRFVITKFDEIREVHPLSHTLSQDWPTEADIDAIVSKSSGQFIYAATVMRFIQHSSGSPALSLRTIHGMQPATGDNPLAHLNAVYSYVFSRACNVQAVKAILCVQFIVEYIRTLSAYVDFEYLLEFVGYDAVEIESCFADLVAIVRVTTTPHLALVFYHASLPDYLKDKSRSGVYHVDVGEIAMESSLVCLKKFHDYRSLHHAILVLDSVKVTSIELSNLLLEASTHQFNVQILSTQYDDAAPAVVFSFLIWALEALYFETDRILFKRLLRKWLRFAFTNQIWIEWNQPNFDHTLAQWY